MTYLEFKRTEKYLYYSPLFDELILGSIKEEDGLTIYLDGKKIADLVYVGEL